MGYHDAREQDIDRVSVQYLAADGRIIRVPMMTFITERQRGGQSFYDTAGKLPTAFIEELIEFGESWVNDGMGHSVPVLLYDPHPTPAMPVGPRARR